MFSQILIIYYCLLYLGLMENKTTKQLPMATAKVGVYRRQSTWHQYEEDMRYLPYDLYGCARLRSATGVSKY